MLFCRTLRDENRETASDNVERLELYEEVLRCNPDAFEYVTHGKQSTRVFSFILFSLLEMFLLMYS